MDFNSHQTLFEKPPNKVAFLLLMVTLAFNYNLPFKVMLTNRIAMGIENKIICLLLTPNKEISRLLVVFTLSN
jgi:hypothetical protein